MATFWRKGHYRGTSWVSGHRVTRYDFNKTSSINNHFLNYSYELKNYKSFTIPNFKCRCGAEVFFYHAPNGGRVFFNELGHPWKKHSCKFTYSEEHFEHNTNYELLETYQIIKQREEPSWKKDGWIPAIYLKEEYYDSSIIKITFKSMIDYEEYSFFIKAKQFSSFDMREGLAINFRAIDEILFEISFYLDVSDRKHILIGSKSSNLNELEEFIIISNGLKLAKENNVNNMKLVETFFNILNISNKYKNEKKQIYNLLVDHSSSMKSGMSRVYFYIYEYGIEEFEKDFFNNFESYSQSSICILLSLQKKSLLDNVCKYIINKWKQDGWKIYYYKEEKHRDTSISEIILKAEEDNKEYSYYIQKKYFNSKIKNKIPIFLKPLNESFFEISFYSDSSSKVDKIILAKNPSNYELDVFTFIKKGLNFIKQEKIENIELVEIFFRVSTISDKYKEEKKQLNNFIINHKISKETGMLDIYLNINKVGIEEFKKNLLDNLKFYDDKIINILSSLNATPTLEKISETILKYKNRQIEKVDLNVKQKNIKKPKNKITLTNNQKEKKKVNHEKVNIVKTKKNKLITKNRKIENLTKVKNDKTNLKHNRNGWKGITIINKKQEKK